MDKVKLPPLHPYRCDCGAPARVWEPNGDGTWSSREWRDKEKMTYERTVLGRAAK